MSINVDPTWLIAVLLGSVRAAAWLVVIPPFSGRRIVPAMALVAVAVGFGLLSAPQLEAHHLPVSMAGIVGSVLLQVVTGLCLGFVVQILLSAFSSAGSMVDLFGGLNLPPSEDPLSQSQIPIMGQFYEQVAVALLFVTNGELLLVRGFEASFGAPGLTLSSLGTISKVFSSDLVTFFTAALEIAAPIIAVLFAGQIALALLSKAAPQVNAWILGFPAQALLALVMVAVGIRVLPAYLSNVVGRMVQDMMGLVGAR